MGNKTFLYGTLLTLAIVTVPIYALRKSQNRGQVNIPNSPHETVDLNTNDSPRETVFLNTNDILELKNTEGMEVLPALNSSRGPELDFGRFECYVFANGARLVNVEDSRPDYTWKAGAREKLEEFRQQLAGNLIWERYLQTIESRCIH